MTVFMPVILLAAASVVIACTIVFGQKLWRKHKEQLPRIKPPMSAPTPTPRIITSQQIQLWPHEAQIFVQSCYDQLLELERSCGIKPLPRLLKRILTVYGVTVIDRVTATGGFRGIAGVTDGHNIVLHDDSEFTICHEIAHVIELRTGALIPVDKLTPDAEDVANLFGCVMCAYFGLPFDDSELRNSLFYRCPIDQKIMDRTADVVRHVCVANKHTAIYCMCNADVMAADVTSPVGCALVTSVMIIIIIVVVICFLLFA